MEEKFSILDTETTGRNPYAHELLEIGVIICDRATLNEIERFEIKVKPDHLVNAEPEALVVNRYNDAEWKGAMPQREALELFIEKTKGTRPGGWNVLFDRGFLDFTSWRLRQKTLDELPYSWFEIKSVAEEKLRPKKEWERFNLGTVAEYFGIPHRNAHRAMADAEVALEVLRRLREIS